jgi:hypothetical protein
VPSVAEYLESTADTAGPLGLVLRDLSPAKRAELETEIEEAFEPYSADGGYQLPGVALCAVAS